MVRPKFRCFNNLQKQAAIKKFQELNLSKEIMQVIAETGFTEMTQVQAECIPVLLAGRDLIGQSKTGSGKTAAFIIPILQKIKISNRHPQALILCPTRELCDQVLKQAQLFSKYLRDFKIAQLIGGRPMDEQTKALHQGVHLIVGTPGRTLEHFKNLNFKLQNLKMIVLDEADRLLDDAFAEEITSLMDLLPSDRQSIFFSATFPEVMNDLSHKYQKNPERITIKETEVSKLQIEQFIYAAEKPQKMETLMQILKDHPSKCTLIFCRTKLAVDEIGKKLKHENLVCEVLHADLKQVNRDEVTRAFRDGKLQVLVATDVAARGIDIDILQLVINFDLPSNVETYIHRIGRTGRAGRTGQAVSIATEYESTLVNQIEAATGVKMTFL
ncbi:MAG: DEAD/DEAH box helicase [Bdellovibrio sp.]|nr:DEAD/DEAH box helicase [Bdellovibrio sp.]